METTQLIRTDGFKTTSDGYLQISKYDKVIVAKLADLLARSFFNYPMYTFLFPNEKIRKKKLRRYFHVIIKYGLTYGEVYTTSTELEAVSIWLSSKDSTFPASKVVKSGISAMYARMGLRFLLRSLRLKNHYPSYLPNRNFTEKDYPYYLVLLGVDPQHQRKGFAKSLLKNKLKEIKDRGHPCYLETYLEKNVHIYEKMGFKILKKADIPKFNLNIWSMKME